MEKIAFLISLDCQSMLFYWYFTVFAFYGNPRTRSSPGWERMTQTRRARMAETWSSILPSLHTASPHHPHCHSDLKLHLTVNTGLKTGGQIVRLCFVGTRQWRDCVRFSLLVAATASPASPRCGATAGRRGPSARRIRPDRCTSLYLGIYQQPILKP